MPLNKEAKPNQTNQMDLVEHFMDTFKRTLIKKGREPHKKY